MAGTSAWMAPENLGAQPKVGEKSDIYALGILLWAISACSEPYAKAANIFTIMDQIKHGVQEEIPADTPSSYAAIIRQCWALEPSARPNAESVAHALEAMADGPEAGAGASGPSYREDTLAGAGSADGPSYRDMSAMP